MPLEGKPYAGEELPGTAVRWTCSAEYEQPSSPGYCRRLSTRMCMKRLKRLGWMGLPASLVMGALLGLPALSGAPRAAELPRFCQKLTVEAVESAAVGQAIQGVSLALERHRVHPGQRLQARLLNRGKSLASYGQYHRIEQYSGPEWVIDPASPHGPWVKKLWGLGPGRAGRCFEWVIPVDQPIGTYRFIVPVKVNGMRAARIVVFEIG